MLRAALLWICLALPAAAQDVHERLGVAFDGWLSTQGINGALASSVVEQGVRPPNDSTGELASVSKSITAVCAYVLVEEGRLNWSDTVAAVLGQGPDVSLGHLVTHSSGLVRDSTQAAMPLWLDRPADPRGHNAAAVLDLIVARGAPQGQLGAYAYNNENYALVSLMIEAASGTTYQEACWPRLGLGTGLRPSTRSGPFLPWGGVMAGHSDYLAFLNRYFGPGSPIAEDPFSLPHAEMGGGVYYGLGMVFRPRDTGVNFWHFGAHCFPGRLEAGSLAVIWEGKVSALATYDACVSWDAMAGLDAALRDAVYRKSP